MTTYSIDPSLYLFTSLTAGSSHIVSATSRLDTILRANRIPFKAVDIATDEKARMLWGRRAGKDENGRLRKLPGLVQEGFVLGDMVEVEEWNEYGELKQHVKIYYDEHTIPSIHNKFPEPIKHKKKATSKASAAATSSAAAAAGSPAPAPAPTSTTAPIPPPAPEPKAVVSSAPPVTNEKSHDSRANPTSQAGPSGAIPIRSVADEAAKKAKEMRLRSLREKVHGKEQPEDREPAEEEGSFSAAPDGEAGAEPKSTNISNNNVEHVVAQSPTSTAWKQSRQIDVEGGEMLQSPTSKVWKQAGTHDRQPSGSHTGGPLVGDMEADIKAMESKSAIQEEPEREELKVAGGKAAQSVNGDEEEDTGSEDDSSEEDGSSREVDGDLRLEKSGKSDI